MSERITLMGCSIDNLSLEESLQAIAGFMQTGKPHQHVVVNVDKLVKASCFDVAIGHVKRAPLWMQKAGLEWSCRFLPEPRRMFRRYFIEDMAFFRLLLRELKQGR